MIAEMDENGKLIAVEILYREGSKWIWNSAGRLYELPPDVQTETDAQVYVAMRREALGYDMNYRLRIGGRA
jgi:hypothetical protein